MNDAVARLAAEQEGLITRRQAIGLGMTDDAIRAQLNAGRWQRIHPGGFAVFGGPLTRSAMLWAAVLRCGRGATLSHESAAEVLGLLDGEPAGSRIHITIPSGRDIDEPPGIRRHYSSRLGQSRHPVRRPPCTRLEETAVDLTQTAVTLDRATAVLAEAVRRRLTTTDRLLAAVDARSRVRWRKELKESCGMIATGAQSLLEVRYYRRVEQSHGLPRAARQSHRKVDGHGIVIDADYELYRTRVELDGRRGHTGDGIFRDLWRDNRAAAAGEDQLRFGWDDIDQRPCDTAALVAKVLADNGWSGTIQPCTRGCRAPQTLISLKTAA